MRGDALASGQQSAKFTHGETLTDEEFNKRVGAGAEPLAEAKVFCECNDDACEGMAFYSAKEFSDHVTAVHK